MLLFQVDDDELYPEIYRNTRYVKGSNLECPEPYRVGRIQHIYHSKGKEDDVKFIINKFYRY